MTFEWHRSLQLAWESFLEGSVPVGCVITDGSGEIVAEGRNRVASREPGEHGLAATYIAHAEINALAALPPGEFDDHTIWSTLEPCFMCSGAIVHSHIGVSRFAASDPLIGGAERMPELNAWVASRWPQRVGPDTGPLGAFCGLLHLVWHERRKPNGTVMRFHRSVDPELAKRVSTAVETLHDPPDTWQDAARILGFDLP